MAPREEKVSGLIESSKMVIKDCCLENGSIVAANPIKPYYPKDAKSYFYVWPRDAFFTCMAADILQIEGIQEKYFKWLMERAESWRETGLFYEKYHVNGLQALHRFQPDQTGCVIISASNFLNNEKYIKYKERYERLVVNSAEGLCNAWNNKHFSTQTNDLWEEKNTFPDLEDNFMYSLSACIKGLSCANELFPNKRYAKTAKEMKDLLVDNAEEKGNLFRAFGKIDDLSIDASLLGVIWPFEVIGYEDTLAENTLELIKEKLVNDYGVYRYEKDIYDGWMHKGEGKNKGAGFWPILNFWMCIVLNKMGKKKDAEKYYQKVIDSLDGDLIPEQIFNNKIQKSVSPLCWSHSMFIIATKELGYID